MAVVSDRDRQLARRLPDEFLMWPARPRERVAELVSAHWMSYDAQPRRELAQALPPVLEELAEPGREATDPRDLCETIVAVWVARQ